MQAFAGVTAVNDRVTVGDSSGGTWKGSRSGSVLQVE